MNADDSMPADGCPPKIDDLSDLRSAVLHLMLLVGFDGLSTMPGTYRSALPSFVTGGRP